MNKHLKRPFEKDGYSNLETWLVAEAIKGRKFKNVKEMKQQLEQEILGEGEGLLRELAGLALIEVQWQELL